jgi:hypothetical protein
MTTSAELRRPLSNSTSERLAEHDGLRVVVEDPRRQRRMQVGAVDLVVRRTVELDHLVAAQQFRHQRTGLPMLDAPPLGLHAELVEDVAQPDRVQDVRGIRADRQPGTDLPQLEGLLVDAGPEPEGLQRARGGQAGDAGADDEDVEFAHG